MMLPRRITGGAAGLSYEDADALEARAIEAGMQSRWQRAVEAVAAGVTSVAEVRRVLGLGHLPKRP